MTLVANEDSVTEVYRLRYRCSLDNLIDALNECAYILGFVVLDDEVIINVLRGHGKDVEEYLKQHCLVELEPYNP